ncbi:MAG TPA: sugar transferase [Ktedonobacterales bacterium]
MATRTERTERTNARATRRTTRSAPVKPPVKQSTPRARGTYYGPSNARSGKTWREWQPAAIRPFGSLQLPVSERRVILIVGDVIASVISVFIALRLWAERAGDPFDGAFIGPRSYWFLVLPVLWVVLASANDYYNLRVSADLWSSAARLVRVTLSMLVLYLAAFFFAPLDVLPRRFILYYAVLSLLLVGLWRLCRVFLIGWTGFRRRAVIVGSGRAAELIWQAVKDEASGDYELVGALTSDEDDVKPSKRTPWLTPHLGTARALPRLVAQYGVSEVILAYVNEVPGDVFDSMMTCYERGISIVPMPMLYERITGRVPVEHVGDYLWAMVLPLEQRGLPFALYQMARRLLDIIFATMGLLLFVAVLPVLALAIRLDSPGPIFYSQRRVGRAGRLFTVYKLRSMVVGAEAESGAQWARAGDPRITRIGRFLRRTRLDEVPQLYNVLRGEMSVIGPRPERPEFVDELAAEIPFYRTRLAATPGLTGWAQVRYRYGNSTEDALRKLQYDLYYIRHQSPMLDLMIVLRTIGVMLLFRGT